MVMLRKQTVDHQCIFCCHNDLSPNVTVQNWRMIMQNLHRRLNCYRTETCVWRHRNVYL